MALTKAHNRMIFGASVNVKDYGAIGDGVADDTAAIQAAVNALQENQVLIFSGLFRTNGVITFTTSSCGVTFDNARFFVGDTGASATTVSGATGKIGFHFKQVTKVQITGSAEFIGQGTSGVTSLLGLYFDTCTDLSCPAFMRFETMAIGRGIRSCVRSSFGDAVANDMNGLQTFESPPTNNAGSVEVIVGSTYCQFGDVVSFDTEKPARYLSIGSGATDNIACSFGSTVCDGVNASPATAHALAIRSAVDCSFGPVICNGTSQAVLVQQYNTDAAFSVNRVFIDAISGPFPSTVASTDSALEMSTTSSNPLGSVAVGSIDVNCSGEFAVFVTSGNLSVNTMKLSGSATRLLNMSNGSGVGDVSVDIGTLIVSNHTGASEVVQIGKGVSISIGHINILTGANTSGKAFIRYNASAGTGSLLPVSIGSIRYTQSGASNDYNYFIFDNSGANPFTAWYVGNIDGDTGAAHMFVDNRDFFIRRGNYFTNALTSLAAAYEVGDILWDNNAAAGGSPGWYCVTGGSPGTWKEMAVLAV